jgi:hypothetical protein
MPATGVSTSTVEPSLGLSTSPRTLGVQGENVWISTGLDHDAAFARRGDVLRGRPPACLVSFPSLRNPQALGQAAEVVTCADHARRVEPDALRGHRRHPDPAVHREHAAGARAPALFQPQHDS